MNSKIKQLVDQAKKTVPQGLTPDKWLEEYHTIFAQLVVEATLTQVAERAYYTGDRDWSDEVDRQWIQLEFGYGKLHDARSKA